MTKTDDDDSVKQAAWRQTFDDTARSYSPTGLKAVRPEAPTGEVLTRVLLLTRDLGLDVITLIAEIRKMKRTVRVQHVLGLLVGLGFLIGAAVQWEIHTEQQEARKLDRQYLSQRIEQAERELKAESAASRRLAQRAAESARNAATAGLLAQIEAAEVHVRLMPPREKEKIQAKLEKKKEAAKKLGADL